MLDKIDEEMLDGGYLLEWAYDSDTESPRTLAPLGNFYCWERGIISPDPCDYSGPVEWMADELRENLSQEEMEQAVRDGKIASLRFATDEDGEEVLEAQYKSYFTGKEGWDEVTDYNEWRDAEEIAKAIAECSEAPGLLAQHGALLTVYRFEHSGVAYSTSPFNDPWDSGPVGFIWVSDKELEQEQLDGRPKDEILKMLSDEVEEYSAWANGECYAVMLSKDDDIIDYLGGLIGDDMLEYGLNEMRRYAAELASAAA